MWLDIICSGLTFKTSKRSGKRISIAAPDRLGRFCLSAAKCVLVVYQSSIQDPAGTNFSHWHPWLLSPELSPPCSCLKGMRGCQL